MSMKSGFVFKAVFAAFFLVLPSPALQAGGIPVIDGTNLTQTTMTAFESVAQTLKQIEEYEQQVMQYMTQLQQLEDQIKNTAAPALYLWDQAESTMQKAQELQSKIENLYSSVGDVDGYLDKLGNVDYWKGATYYDLKKGGTREGLKELQEQDAVVNEAQQMANEDLLKTIKEQKDYLSDEASRLSSLQKGAESAGGRMEAIQSTNQLMSQQNSLLLNLKSLALAQSQAVGQQLVAEQQKAAQEQAASETFLDVKFGPSVEPDYSF